jgi:hypothetical protein
MSRLIRHRPSPALVVAVLALIIAMAGTSYAAIKLPANSVGTKQIKANAIVSSKIKDGSLTAKDFAKAQLPNGAQGIQGIAGPAGPQGAKGDTGPPAVNFIDVVNGVPPGGDAHCPPGEIATGGGGASATGTINESAPLLDGNDFPIGWHVTAVLSDGSTSAPATAWAVCVG